MVAFAANSLLGRGALGQEAMGPGSFTALRLVSGALVLVVLNRVRSSHGTLAGSWRGAVALLVYALGFSFAYRSLAAGTGALILFAAVQLTMMGANWLEGGRPSAAKWLGAALAFGGLAWLLAPGAEQPAP